MEYPLTGASAQMDLRVYIAKITFTTLIDHFTSLCFLAPVYSNQLIKLELLGASAPHSINKATKVATALAVYRHSTRLSVWPWLHPDSDVRAAVVILLRINSEYPIETTHSNNNLPQCQYIFCTFTSFRLFFEGAPRNSSRSVSGLPQAQSLSRSRKPGLLPVAALQRRGDACRVPLASAGLYERSGNDAHHVI